MRRTTVFKTIAWATDMSPSAEAAGVLASDMASAMGARLIVIHVTEVALGHAGAAVNPDEEQIGAALQRTLEDLRRRGIDSQPAAARHPVGSGAVAQQIVDLASSAGAEVLIVGTRGRGPVAGLLLGSVALRLLHAAPCPILVVPERRTGDR
jgi:nucleotide-binding universal stress UspA family protein